MANRSNWKNFEWEIARALGGKRRLRTMESFGAVATDVYFPKEIRKQHPFLKRVMVECKKRKTLSAHHSFYAEALLKYGGEGKYLILATRIPATRKGRKKWEKLRDKLKKQYGSKVKLREFTGSLVTVNLEFFQELWNAWLAEKKRIWRFPR